MDKEHISINCCIFAKRKKIRMKTRILKICLIVFTSVILIIGGVCWFIYKKINTPNNCTDSFSLYIDEKTTRKDVVSVINEKCNEDAAYWVDKIFEVKKRRVNRYPGFYKITPEMSAWDIYNILALGDNSTANITFNNIRTKEDLAKAICKYINMPADSLYKAICDNDVCKSYGFDTVSIVTMFLPDSYNIFKTTTVKNFLDRMYKEYNNYWNEERLNKAKENKMTPYEITILASIVEEETKKPDEMDIVAGLYINRINKGMLLQSDPTVKFATGDFSLRRILNKHLKIDSPYNTYMYKGLPPGPIRIPSKIAIEKSLNYKKSNYIFMCAKEDFSGYHNFATSLREHNRNAAKYRRELNKRNIK